jgi:signal transduction histidine kinase
VKELVRLMEGKVRFESQVGVGTVFHVSIPLEGKQA